MSDSLKNSYTPWFVAKGKDFGLSGKSPVDASPYLVVAMNVFNKFVALRLKLFSLNYFSE